MANNTLVSVVIPVFNGASYVEQAVKSVQEQTVKSLEIIVVDDGSTDGTQEVLRDLVKTSKISWSQVRNGGPGYARNYGIKKAIGEYIAFLDCDDIWFPKKLEAQLALLKKQPHVGLAYTDYREFNDKEPIAAHANPRYSREPLAKAFLGGQFGLLSTVLVNRKILEKVSGFDPELHVAEDWDLIVKIYDVAPFGYIDQVLVHKINHIHGVWDRPCDENTYRRKVLSSRQRFLNRLENRGELTKQQRAALNREWAGYYILSGTLSERLGNLAEARRCYLAAIRIAPLHIRGFTRLFRAFRPNRE